MLAFPYRYAHSHGRQRTCSFRDRFSSSSFSLKPSDSISQVNDLSPEAEVTTQHMVKRRKLRATSTWDHFREAQGNEPRTLCGRLLHYCTYCRNPSWSTHISSNARYHLEKNHHIVIEEDSKPRDKRQLAIENAFPERQSNSCRKLEKPK